MTPMPGKRHTGVGMQRAKKKKVVPAATVEDESQSDDEVEDAPPASTPSAPPPCIGTTAPCVGGSCGSSGAVSSGQVEARLKRQLADAKVAVRAAQFDVDKKERKWERVKKSYLDNDKYSRWDEPSVVARVELRLFRADIGLGKARAVLVQRMGSCTRLRAFLAWHARLVATGGQNPLVQRFYQRAFDRVQKPTPLPKWKSMWPGMSHNIWEWNRQNYGLAVT